MVKAEIILGALEAFLDCPAQTCRPGQFRKRGLGGRKDQIIAEGVRIRAAFADEDIAGIAFLNGIRQSYACPVIETQSLGAFTGRTGGPGRSGQFPGPLFRIRLQQPLIGQHP